MRIHLLLLSLLIFESIELQCGVENIEHCQKCGTGTEANSCETCDDKYFPFLDNVLCLPCDDSRFGDIGCGGQCNKNITYSSGNYYDYKFSCENGCKEGYFNLGGKCESCRNGCRKCTYEPPYEMSKVYERYIKCQECTSNQYKLTNQGKCEECYARQCNKCHYEGENKICDECSSGYYLKDSTCIQCNWILLSEGKICEACSDDKTKYNPDSCKCITHYTEGDSNKCIKCPDNCYSCGYNSQSKKTKCFNCDEGFTLNSKGICVNCGDNCKYCYLDANENPMCLSCMSGKDPNDDKNCLQCDDNCASCIKSKDNQIECTKCNNYFGLLPDKTCTLCPLKCQNCFWKEEKNNFGCSKCTSSSYIIGKDDICVSSEDTDEIGFEGCEELYYDKDNNKYKCTKCSESYAIVYNEYKCLPNSNSKIEFVNGCLNASYNSDKKIYECITCEPGYIYILHENKCLTKEESNLSSLCSEANNTGTKDMPKYSCVKCLIDILFTKIFDYNTNTYDCELPLFEPDLTNCVTGTKNIMGKKNCRECKYGLSTYYDTELLKSRCPDSCKNGSFLIYNFCYECDDVYYGNPGCISKSGCNYDVSLDKFSCNECKEGYFQSSQGCSPCSEENKGCKKCSMSNNNFECEECFDGYNLNSTNKLCELIECKEYPEISLGCLICDDKLNEYKPKSKCQSCKDGYFKTKDESCVYCKSHGGNGCEQCAYSEYDQIICTYCPEGSVFENYEYCSNCDEKIEGCSICRYIYTDKIKKIEKLVCTKCKEQYYLTSDGYCIYPNNYIETISNCDSFTTSSQKEAESITIQDDIINYDYTIHEEKFSISSYCNECNKGYYRSNGKCFKINYDECSLSSIFLNNTLNYICYTLCSDSNNYAMLNYYVYSSTKITNIDSVEQINIMEQLYNGTLYHIISRYSYNKDVLFKSLNMDSPMCIGNLGTGDKNNPTNLRKCKKAIYNKIEDKYECIECLSGYSLDNEKKTCIQNVKLTMNEHPGLECDVENIGTDSEPIYSCKSCYNPFYILATTESKAKICVNPHDSENFEIYYCTGAYADTYYAKNNYNCTNCSSNSILYESQFYKRKICQNTHYKIERFSGFNITEFSKDKESVEAKDGICENKKLFTPDNKNCFSCKSVMPGCKGSCTFSLERENLIECEENGCKTGYIEAAKGVCESCDRVNSGCIECHYEDKYPSDYKGFKRKRRFVCDQCREGYLVAADSTCHSCSSLGLYNCERCIWDENNNNELVCTKCTSGYFLDEFGKCTQCEIGKARVDQNKCAFCDNKEYGGIEGCSICKSDNNRITECILCKKGFLFLETNKTCLKRAENIKYGEHSNCMVLDTYYYKLKCSLCELYNYVLFKGLLTHKCYSIDNIPSHDIYYNQYCQEITIIDSKYSCNKCLDNKYFDQFVKFTKFTFESNQTSFCDVYYHYDLGPCENATISEEEDGTIKYSCDQCFEDGIKSYDSESKIYYCNYNLASYESSCLIEYCQECQKDNNKICEKCLNNYEINSITGSCVKKTEKIPSIIFTDIYGLEMNQGNSLNGQELYGPALKLRGLTNSQINEGHAFSINLSIELKRSYIKNHTKEVPMVCQLIGDGVDESEDEPNMVEYYCMGNLTSSENYQLNELAGDDIGVVNLKEDSNKNTGIIMPTNIDSMSFANIQETKSQFSLNKFLNTLTFIPKEIKNQTSKDYNFEFTIQGNISGEVDKLNLDTDIPLVEVEKSAECTLNIEDKLADLICKINLKEYKDDYDTFSLKSFIYEDEFRTIIFSQLNEIYLININDEAAGNEENDENGGNGDKKGGFKTLYIIIIAAGGGAILITTIVIALVKRNRPKEITNIGNQYMPNQYMPNQNMQNQGINPVKIDKRIGKNSIKKMKNKIKKIDIKKVGKKSKGTKKNDKIDGNINENESSKRGMITFNNKKK